MHLLYLNFYFFKNLTHLIWIKITDHTASKSHLTGCHVDDLTSDTNIVILLFVKSLLYLD